LDATLSLDSREDWRDWLKRNHDRAEEVWLKISKKHTRTHGISYEEGVEEAICFGWIDGKMKSMDEETYMLRFSPRRRGSLWSELNREKAVRMIKARRMTRAGMEKVDEAKKNGRWDSAYSSRKEPVPPDQLNEALSKDTVALRNFNELSNSKKMAYIHWINEAKKDETRERRIEETIRAMKARKSLI